MDKISVIVPIYNSEKYLKVCIESIMNQTYTNFEVLLINDGSTDNSSNICKDFSNRYRNIKTFNLTHQGVANARNFGISKSSGKYICFIDSDDMISPNFFKDLINMITTYNSDIAETGFRYMNEKYKENKRKIEIYDSIKMAKRLYSKNGVRTAIITNKLFNIKLFENIKFENRENEDEFIIHKLIFATNKPIVIDNQKLYIYRIHKSSRQTNFNAEKLRVLEVFEQREKYFSIDEELMMKNEIGKLDLILYLSYICNQNGRTKEQEELKKQFTNEYRNLNIRPDFRRRIKYKIFMKKPQLIIKIIALRNRKKYE